MTVTCIIPAFNEGPRIATVAGIAARHPALAEVIVVDDGSADDTAIQAAAVPGVRVIRQAKNGGKTAALARGLACARGDFVLLLDADLIGLRAEDISALIAPALSGQAAVTISLRGNAPALWKRIGLDYISGERVVPRALLLPYLDALPGLPPFGFEVFLNHLLTDGRLPLAVVPWPGVSSPLKRRKYGFWRGLRGDVGMLADMFHVHGPITLMRQISAMRALRVTLPDAAGTSYKLLARPRPSTAPQTPHH
ncbi:glycosyltransferase family 2 protein [Paracoccus sp. (in: a-proteobacteria)]|uniref:glycosyltransferase family 2 protein n=1 Tax=Paracoccus sp. TaxID=267 RepID=UPI0026E018B4|nr:glycosyltransferase family 2 protein [Paracoccus sp. (in: a-proteobacteria)]MDO5646988.1 glycosyltransferase family 2 protein [Paracoccus sp. (in: a-proteobacteria)]